MLSIFVFGVSRSREGSPSPSRVSPFLMRLCDLPQIMPKHQHVLEVKFLFDQCCNRQREAFIYQATLLLTCSCEILTDTVSLDKSRECHDTNPSWMLLKYFIQKEK